jgi:hypothetical protein
VKLLTRRRGRGERPYVGRHRDDALVVDGERGSAGDDQLVGVNMGDPVRVTDYTNETEDRPDNYVKGI